MANVLTGVVGLDFGAYTSQSIVAGGSYVMPKGIYYVFDDAAADIKVQLNKNISTPAFADLVGAAVGIGGLYISNGVDLKFVNTDGSNAATLLYQEVKFLP